jgi:hypothetical protein
VKKRGRKARRAREAERRSAQARQAELAAAAAAATAVAAATAAAATAAAAAEPAPVAASQQGAAQALHATVLDADAGVEQARASAPALALEGTSSSTEDQPATPPSARVSRPTPVVDSVVQAVIARATSTQPYQRFADAAEMLCELVDRLPRELLSPPGEQLASGPVPTPHGADEAFGGSATLEALASARTSDATLGPRSSGPTLVPMPLDGPVVTKAAPATGIAGRAALGVQPLMAAGLIAAGAAVLLLAIALRGSDDRPLARRRIEPTSIAAAPAKVATRARPAAVPVPNVMGSETTLDTALAGEPRPAVPAVSPLPKPKPPVVPAAWAQPVLFNSLRQPPARNPWLEPLPPELEGIPTIVASGAEGEDSMVRTVRAYNRDNEQDARGCLLLGQFYVNRLWRSDAVGQFALALQRDPSARGAPEILPVLFELIIHGKAASAAEELIQKAYGAEALPAIDVALSQVTTTLAAQRLHALSARLADAEQAKVKPIVKPTTPLTR